MKIVCCSISDVLQQRVAIGTRITVRGWVRTRRDSKGGFSFIALYDGSCLQTLQVVAQKTLPNYAQQVLLLTAGCSLSVTGVVVQSPASGQAVELIAEQLTVYGWVEAPESYPIAAKQHSLEHLREVAHLRPRTQLIGAVTRIRHTLAQAIHHFFDQQGFYWITTPIITTYDCEGAGEMFRVSTLDRQRLVQQADDPIDFQQDFFGQEAFLTVSGQLNAESYACALSKVYTFGPTFRAENSNTSRHLAEFWMVEPEIAFAELSDIVLLAQQLLQCIANILLTNCAEDIDYLTHTVGQVLYDRLEQLASTPFIVLDYTEAITLLTQSTHPFDHQVTWGSDLAAEHERYLTEKLFNAPIIVKNYPQEIKAFYMRMNDDGKTVAAMDVLLPNVGEIIGGSQREERLTILDQKLTELGLNQTRYAWYRDLRRYGTVPHAGFGLGFERLVLYTTGMQNVRDVIPFPRYPRYAKF